MFTGNISTTLAGVYRYTLSSDHYGYSNEVPIYVGLRDTYSGYPLERKRIYAKISRVDEATNAGYTILKLVLRIKGYLGDANGSFDICVPEYSYTGSTEKQLFEYCGDASSIDFNTIKWDSSEAVVEITNQTAAKNILKYGVVLKERENVIKVTGINGITAEAYYYTANSPADIVRTTTNGEDGEWFLPDMLYNENGPYYWEQRIDKDLRITWDCLQPFTEQTKYEIGINLYSSSDEAIKIIATGTTEKSVSINRKIWQEYQTENGFNIYIRLHTKNGSVTDWARMQTYCYLHNISNPIPTNWDLIKYEDAITLKWELEMGSPGKAYLYGEITGYSIQYSENDGATFTEAAISNSAEPMYTVNGYTLPIGKVVWRVIPLYDNNTYTSIHSVDGYMVVTADPSTSTVLCDGKPMPTITWESVAQSAYQVKFGDYNSGAVYSIGKSHTIPYFYKDGVYEVMVRTQISTGEWSEWSEPVYVQITNSPPGLGITATAEPAGYRVRVVWTKNSGYTDYIVYRDGVPIHVTDGGISTEGGYMDSMANGVAVYMVRGITADGYYDQSAEITVNAAVPTDILFALGSDEILPLKYTPVFPRTYNYTAEMAVTYRYFAGRSKPVAITSGQISRTLPLSYIDKGRTLARKLLSYVGKTVVFKDSGGDMIVGVLNMANAGMGHVSTTSFQITEVDHNERVAYLPGE